MDYFGYAIASSLENLDLIIEAFDKATGFTSYEIIQNFIVFNAPLGMDNFKEPFGIRLQAGNKVTDIHFCFVFQSSFATD